VAVAATYFSRLTALTIRGEEPRRARVAVEMIDSGDWIVPRQQGEIYFSRPPLQNWAIVLLGLARGEVDAVAIRVPSVLAVLLTVGMVYCYGRGFLSPPASLAAGVAFATMIEVLKLGGLGETDAIFTAMVCGALFTWHWGYTHAWPAARTWIASYLFVALAMLTKGLQGPVFFLGSVMLFLLVMHDGRYLLTRAHASGIATFVLVWAAWHIPYQTAVGWNGILTMYSINVTQRFQADAIGNPWSHYLRFPLEALVCMLPWSVLLLAYLGREFRRAIAPEQSHIAFLFSCFLVALAICWGVPGGRTRYVMPVYPCVACLVGLVLDRYGRKDVEVRRWNMWNGFVTGCVFAVGLEDVEARRWNVWTAFATGCVFVMGIGSLAVLAVSELAPSPPLSQPRWLTFSFLGVSAVLMSVLWEMRKAVTPERRLVGVVAIGIFFAIGYVGMAINAEQARSETSTAQAIAEVKNRLPANTSLVSLGRVMPLFAYYYRDPIKVIPCPFQDENSWKEIDYFCCNIEMTREGLIPFPYSILARVPCDRHRRNDSRNIVVVGRRIRGPGDGLANGTLVALRKAILPSQTPAAHGEACLGSVLPPIHRKP
jgi:4-amino-4-deoxy-L-arabinose transferase-like glycosyltransferase